MRGAGVLRVNIDTASSNGRCRVIFSDTGPGISADVMKRIFEPFVTDKARGTGLGLAVSYRIVRDHDGQLFAENRPGPQGGAVFTVELPLLDPSSDPGPRDAKPAVSTDESLVAENDHAEVAHH
jgi:C4-dicarboxylate-specific signal transduction histidine kinase